MNVAMRKLKIIQAELVRRNINLHTLTTADKAVAVVSCVVALVAGTAVGIEEAAAAPMEIGSGHAGATAGDALMLSGKMSSRTNSS